MRILSNLLRRFRMERDLDRELRYHLERRADDLAASGLSRSDALRQASIEFGGIAQAQEEVRETWVSRWLSDISRDLIYAARTLRKNRGFTSVAVLSLALGIGANAAIFSVFHAVLVRPLPYQNPDRLLSIALVSKDSLSGFVFMPEFVAYRRSSTTFESLTSWNDEQFNLTGTGTPERVVGASVTPDFLSVLGIQPEIGRNLSANDDNVALLSHSLWQRQFGSDRSIVGRTVLLNDQPHAVAGVLPAGFRFPGQLEPEILVASRVAEIPDWTADRMGMLTVVGRLRDGARIEQASAELSAIHASHIGDMPAWLSRQRKGAAMQVLPLQERLVGDRRPTLLVLLGAVGLLLLIACVNVASLQLGRAALRRKEICLRAALGASSQRLSRALTTESLLLAFLGGGAGLMVAWGLLDALKAIPGLPLPDSEQLHLSWTLGGAALLLSTVSGLAIGLVPALTSRRVDLNDVLKSGTRSLVAGSRTLVRSVLVSAQVALALVLLVGSGLFLRSLHNVLVVDTGFESGGVITARINLPQSRYASDAQRAAFNRSLIEAARALPGVTAAGTTNSLPLTGYTMGAFFQVEGQPELQAGKRSGSAVLIVSPGYFPAMGIRLLAGRAFDERDAEKAPRVAIANVSLARRFFGSENVVGKRLRFGSSGEWTTVVGVTADVKHAGREKDAQPELFVPAAQMPAPRVNLAVRGKGDPAQLAAGLRAAVWAIDKDLPVYDVVTMDDRLRRSGQSRQAQTLLLAAFAMLALALAAIGLYGVVSEAVHQRTSEIGLRMALGAGSRDVRRMVMKRSLLLVAAGVGAGSIGAFWFTRSLTPLLYGVKPMDAATFACVALVLMAVALLAAYVPARRASRIDPLIALRTE